MKEKLWTKEYLFSLLLVFWVNMGYALLNSVIAIYGTVLTSSSVMGGYMITVFTISALFVRLFIKKLNEKFSNKVLLIFGLCLTVIASIGYCLANDIVTFLIFRMIHGFGFGISLTCATAISNEYVPSSRLSEGVGFTSSANTIANAIGPTIALEILGTNFFTLFAVLLIISAVILGLSLFVKSNTKAQKVNNEHQSYSGVIIACLFFLATFCQGAVNSFLTSYTKELNFGNIGYGLGAVVWGYVSQFFGYQVLYVVAALLIVVMIVFDQIFYQKVN